MRNMALIAISLLCTHTQLFNCSLFDLEERFVPPPVQL